MNEEFDNLLHNKTVADLTEKHFSRYGEFLVSFELSKHGWNIYQPVYDEYIDFLIHKYICTQCNTRWNHTPALICKSCGKDFSKTEKHNIKTGTCLNCNSFIKGNTTKCTQCQSTNITHIPTCDNCKGEVEMKTHTCSCGSTDYDTKFRTIQVKSFRIEFNDETGKTKNTYAIDMKPKDLIQDNIHFFIWCLIDDTDRPRFLVLSVQDFIITMGGSMKGISFLKDQDRQHFSSNDFGKWKDFLNRFDKLE